MRAKFISESSNAPKPSNKLFEKEWFAKLKVGDIFSMIENEELDVDNPDDFDQFKSLIMPKMRNFYDKMVTFLNDEDELIKLEDIIEQLDNAEDTDEWDYSWEDFYDWADTNNIWIESFDNNGEDVESDIEDEEMYN